MWREHEEKAQSWIRCVPDARYPPYYLSHPMRPVLRTSLHHPRIKFGDCRSKRDQARSFGSTISFHQFRDNGVSPRILRCAWKKNLLGAVWTVVASHRRFENGERKSKWISPSIHSRHDPVNAKILLVKMKWKAKVVPTTGNRQPPKTRNVGLYTVQVRTYPTAEQPIW